MARAPGKARAREVLPLSDADLQDSTFLTREQEVHLFRKMNFLKYQAAQLREAINPSRARSADLDRVEELLREAGSIRNRIIRSYLGLVVSIVRKSTGPCQDFLDLVSEGNVSLIQASERIRLHARYPVQHVCDPGDHQRLCPANSQGSPPQRPVRHRLRGAVAGASPITVTVAARKRSIKSHLGKSSGRSLGCLDDREQTIIVRRFGLAGEKQTLVRSRPGIGDQQGARPPARVPRLGQTPYPRRGAATRSDGRISIRK